MESSVICLGSFTSRATSDVAVWPVGGVVAISEHMTWTKPSDNFIFQTDFWESELNSSVSVQLEIETSAARVWDTQRSVKGKRLVVRLSMLHPNPSSPFSWAQQRWPRRCVPTGTCREEQYGQTEEIRWKKKNVTRERELSVQSRVAGHRAQRRQSAFGEGPAAVNTDSDRARCYASEVFLKT